MKEDRALCPVRALKYYLDRTQPILKGRKKLFIAFKSSYTKEIAPITISSWCKATIKLAYQYIKPADLQVLRVSGHQIRSMSWATLGGVSVEQIMEACHWAFHNTFTSYYLKDLVWNTGDQFKLGQFVAAQQVVAITHRT